MVDLCAAPGSWSQVMSTTQNHLKTFLQVLSKKLRSERPEEERDAVKIVAVDLQVQTYIPHSFGYLNVYQAVQARSLRHWGRPLGQAHILFLCSCDLKLSALVEAVWSGLASHHSSDLSFLHEIL